MRGLRAALYKDFKLFFRGTGALALVLPFLLLLALRVGMGDLSRQAYVQPFPIAVQDLDNTIMSRSLISQIRQIQLFSQVEVLDEGEPAEQALARGSAAVVTIPQDFFYDLYSMRDCPVDVVLNEDMPLESTLFQTIFSSVMDIIRADQSAGIGLYRFCYGELTPQLQSQLYRETSEHLLVDALSRQTVFDSQAQLADVQSAMERRLLACVLSMLALFFPLLAVKTLPEELSLGVLPRFRGIGGRGAGFVLSKLAVSLLLTLPTLALILLSFPSERPAAVLALSLILLLGAFGLLLGLAAWAGNPSAVQRWGNLLILLSLVLGGTLWPRHLLPQPLPRLGVLTLPYYAVLGLEAIHRGLSWGQLLSLLWPVLALGTAGAALAVPGLRRLQGQGSRRETPFLPPVRSLPESGAVSPPPARLAGLAAFKFRTMAGGTAGLAALLVVALLCGGAALAGSRGNASALRLALVDEDGSALSQDLCEALEGRDGLSLTRCRNLSQGQRMVLLGEVEGLLILGEGYQDAMEASDPLPLSYEQAASSLSAQGAREVVAGQVAVQRSRLRAVEQAESHLDRTLSPEEQQTLLDEIDRVEAEMPSMFHIRTSQGAAPRSPFYPGPMGFSCLAVLGLEAIHRGLSWGQLLSLLWPVLALGTAGAALAVPGLRRLQGQGSRRETPFLPPVRSLPESGAVSPPPARLAGLAAFKFRTMAGGTAGLAALLVVALLCGGAALAGSRGNASALRLALVDEDGSALSQDLCEALEGRDGLSLTRCRNLSQGQRMVLLGEVEGLLILGEGYQDAMEASDPLPLSYEQAASSLSAQGAREVVAGQVAVQRSRLRAVEQAESHLDRTLSPEEQQTLLDEIDRVEAEMPSMFHIRTSQGAAPRALESGGRLQQLSGHFTDRHGHRIRRDAAHYR